MQEWREKGGLRGLLASQVGAWIERRQAARTCRDLLARYREIVATSPGLGERERLRMLIMSRTACDAAWADRILESASESYASWPVRRELTLRDVVHYLAVAEFLAGHEDEHWLRSDLREIVASCIPAEFAVQKPIREDSGEVAV